VPLFNIPETPQYHLSNAPLVQALAQVRFPLVASLESMAGIAPLQEALRDDFPYMEQEKTQEISFVVGPAGPGAGSSAESVTWEFTNDVGNLLVIGAGSATLSAGASYSGVANFSKDFASMLSALTSARVPRCDRLGVRYLSLAANLPGEERSWGKWFKPEIVGWAGADVVDSSSLETSMNQVKLRRAPVGDLAGPPADIEATVRHGAVPAQTIVPGIPPIQVAQSSYLLDLDVYVVGHQVFDRDLILEQFELIHSQIDRFFYWSLTSEGVEHFGLEISDS
jgi:uncharacterized protein (TIGR04255 family)